MKKAPVKDIANRQPPPDHTSNARVLIVDGDPAAVRVSTACVHGLGHSVCREGRGGRVDLALVDLEQDGRGIEAAARIGAVPVVYLVGDVTEDVLASAQKTRPAGYVAKPIDERQLRMNVRAALATRAQVGGQQEKDVVLRRALDRERRQTELLESVFDSMNDGVAVFDATGVFRMLNARGRHMIGMKPEDDLEHLSRRFDLCHADDMRPCRPEELPSARVLRGEKFDNYAICIRSSSIADLYLSASGRPLSNPDGTLHGGVTVFSDVTAKHWREQELKVLAETMREQRDAVDAVFDSMADAVVSVDGHGNVVKINASAEQILRIGSSRIGKPMPSTELFLADLETPLPPEQHPLACSLRGDAVDGLRVFFRPAATQRGTYLSISSRPLRDSSGSVRGATAVFRDVTRLHEAEKAQRRTAVDLRRQRDFMQMVFESISDGVVVADAGGKLTMANPSAERMVGMGLTDGPPDTWAATYGTFFPDKATPFPSEELPLVRAMQGVVSNDVELFIRNPHLPQGVHVSVNGRPMRNAADEVEGGVITLRDVTQRVLAREELARAFAHGRLEVVETVLHNIGNAVTSVAVGIATVRERFRRNKAFESFNALAQEIARHEDDWIPWLENDPRGRTVRAFILSLTEDFARHNERVLSTVERVQSRVRHIVDIIQTQESSASGTVERKVVRLRQAIAEAVRVLQESITKRRIAIDIDCHRAPAEIRIQESSLHQVLVNLIKNAIEAIDALADGDGLDAKPLIRILAFVGDDHLVLEVIDNGVGIEAASLRSIFAAGHTTKKSGSGLGLHSAANLVNASGGTIRAFSSGVGRGATMRVTFPLSGVMPARQGQENA